MYTTVRKSIGLEKNTLIMVTKVLLVIVSNSSWQLLNLFFFNYMINKINICKKRYEEKMYFLVNIIFLIHVFFLF